MEVNIWKRFVGLIPGGARTIGKVVFVNKVQGISTVELRDGTTFFAKGTSVEREKYAIIVDGQVVSEAPNLPQYSVEV